jgi:hypothetical protein
MKEIDKDYYLKQLFIKDTIDGGWRSEKRSKQNKYYIIDLVEGFKECETKEDVLNDFLASINLPKAKQTGEGEISWPLTLMPEGPRYSKYQYYLRLKISEKDYKEDIEPIKKFYKEISKLEKEEDKFNLIEQSNLNENLLTSDLRTLKSRYETLSISTSLENTKIEGGAKVSKEREN